LACQTIILFLISKTSLLLSQLHPMLKTMSQTPPTKEIAYLPSYRHHLAK
jgi:hypothetical protein